MLYIYIYIYVTTLLPFLLAAHSRSAVLQQLDVGRPEVLDFFLGRAEGKVAVVVVVVVVVLLVVVLVVVVVVVLVVLSL